MLKERPLRIALLTHSVNPRGGVVHSIELAQALHGAQQHVTLFAPAESGQRLFREVPYSVQLVPVNAAGNLLKLVEERSAGYVRHLRTALALQSFDILHAQDGISANALATLVELGEIPGFVRTVHHLDRFSDARLASVQTRGWQCAEQLFCVSPTWCEIMRREHGVIAELVGNGVDLQRYHPQPDASDGELCHQLGLDKCTGPVFLALGGIEERKNTLRTLQAFARAHGTMRGAQLVIAGGASLLDHSRYGREFDLQLRECGLPPDAVKLIGVVPDAQMPALFRMADVLMSPSLMEGFGLVAIEALACGTPIVVSRIAPFTEHLDDRVCHWADPYDVGSIASAMVSATRAPRGPALRTLALALLTRFSWQASARRHLELYERCLARRAGYLATTG